MKTTPLTEKHIALGAKMSLFAGYNMPISYSSLIEEHHAVRQRLGIFDVSHMGEFIVKGKNALAFVQRVTSNDASKLAIGGVQYACLTNQEGGIIDDLLVYRLPEDKCAEGEQAFMLVVNASNIEKDWNWLVGNKMAEVALTNISERTGLLAVQGPLAAEVLSSLTDVEVKSMRYYTFQKGNFAGIENVLISATGYTGAGGFELYAANEHLVALWDAILEAGKPYGILPVGLGARDTLRLEKGYCLYGNDIDDTTSPLEAGLGWVTKLQKGDFNGKEVLVAQKADGIKRKLVGFELDERRVPRHGYEIEDADGRRIGYVTSGTQSPTIDKPIGMGYVAIEFSAVGTPIFISIKNKKLGGRICEMPFVK